MKSFIGKCCTAIATILALAGGLALPPVALADIADAQALANTRQLLRAQGFKLDLTEFTASNSPDISAREMALTNTSANYSGALPEHPNLMEPVGSNSALAVWTLDSLPIGLPRGNTQDRLSWTVLQTAADQNRSAYDPAYAAILSGPFRFHLIVKNGSGVLLPHLAVMKTLQQTMDERALLALHQGNWDAAWTNILTATRLVTAWQVEPVDMAQLVRFAETKLAYNAIWQALQTNLWTGEQLAQLQHEWEGIDFLKTLPENMAFQRAERAAECEWERTGEGDPEPTLSELAKAAVHDPNAVPNELQHLHAKALQRERGNFDVENEILLYYRDREVELKNAINAPSWIAMRPLPGVTNHAPFISKSTSSSPILSTMRSGISGMRLALTESLFMSRAAEAESLRRILVTAIALERFHGKHHTYPNTLAELNPEFLNSVPLDFIDGQPLRYRLNGTGHFLLYSVGLDCVDNGGKLQRGFRDRGYTRPPDKNSAEAQFDLVWPLPAGVDSTQEEKQIQAQAEIIKARVKLAEHKKYLVDISDREWQQSRTRQSHVSQVLAQRFADDTEVPTFKGTNLISQIGSQPAGAGKLTLLALLTPKQIITGREPEDITFEFPIRYDAISATDAFFVNVDPDPEEQIKFNSGGKIYDRERAPNGNARIVWHAIFDPPGNHAAQIYLALKDTTGTLFIDGPAIAVTTSNLCQFSLDSANCNVETGAIFHARLPEQNGKYSIECLSTNGTHLKTLSGTTANGEFKAVWNLVADDGHRLTGEPFNSTVTITLPDSGKSQTLRGP